MLAELSSLRFGFRAMVPTWLLARSHPQFLVRWGFPEELLPVAKCVSSDGWQESMLTGWEAPVLGNQMVERIVLSLLEQSTNYKEVIDPITQGKGIMQN